MTEPGDPLIEVDLPVPAGEVWAHLREPERIRRWFGWDYDGIDDEIEQIFVQEAEADEAARVLAWEHGDRFELHEAGAGTRLRVVRERPEAGPGGFDPIAEGWITFVQQLRFALTRHPGEPRRTWRGEASAQAPDTLPAAAALGLGAAAGAAPGARYEAAAGPGGALSGEVWFRSAHQLGLTVDQLGDGLLILDEVPPATAPPHGAAAIVVSVHGDAPLDTAAWDAWWAGRLGPPPGG